MYEYYKEYQVKDAKRELNDRYPAVLESDVVFNEIIGIANATFYHMVSRELMKMPACSYITVEDVLQEAAITLYIDRNKSFKNHDFTGKRDFFMYVAGLYKIVAQEIVRITNNKISKMPIVSTDEYADRGKELDKSRNDFDLIDSSNKLTHKFIPDELIDEMYQTMIDERLGQIMFEALSLTNVVPHAVMSYCYSVFVPRMLIVLLNNNEKMLEDIQNNLDMIWLEYCRNENSGERYESEAYYGKLFMDKFDLLLEEKKWNLSIKSFCLSAVISPLIKNNIASAAEDEQQKKQYYRRILKEISFVYRRGSKDGMNEVKEIKIDRDSEVLVEAAKILMGENSIGKLSKDFQTISDIVHMYNINFEWGVQYKTNLDKGYIDKKNNICIDKESELIFSKFFSKPSDETKAKEGMDYLGHNIRNFSVRFKPKLIEDALNIASKCMIIANSDEAMERLRNACKKNTKSKK